MNLSTLYRGVSLAALLSTVPIGAVMMDAQSSEQVIAGLKEQRQGMLAANLAIVEKADEEERELADDELAEIEQNGIKAEKVNKQIQAREQVAKINAGTGRRTLPDGANPTVPAAARSLEAGRGGFRTFGEFAMQVRGATINPAQVDQRLMAAAAATAGSEGVGADGGYAVPSDFRREMWTKIMEIDSLQQRTDQLTTSGNSLTVPADETTPWQNTGGIQVYWEGEGAVATESKPALVMKSIRLNKLIGLVPVSEELLEDAPGLDSWLRSKVPTKMAAKLNTAFIRGTGAGQMLGILNAPSLISVAKESGQVADTVLYANIVNMWTRLYAPLRRNAVWLINQDIEPQLDLMSFDPASATLTPVYLPVGGASATPYATLKGRPVIPVEACSTLGDLGDIILTDLTQYMTLTKGQDIRTDVSMHLYFDAAQLAFRFILRINGQPWWGSSIAPQFGSATRSWAVTLAERA